MGVSRSMLCDLKGMGLPAARAAGGLGACRELTVRGR